MKRTVIACVASVMLTTAGHAAVALQGESIIDTATAACGNVGIVPGVAVKTVLQPKNISGNTANTIVSFVFNAQGVFGLVIDHGAMPAGTGAAFGNNMSGVLKANVGTRYTQFAQTPANMTANTPDATLKGRIENFMFVNNCDVTFRAAVIKDPS